MKTIIFHGGAGLGYYYLGIARYIQTTYNLYPNDYVFIGCSIGCLSALGLASEYNIDSLVNDYIIRIYDNFANSNYKYLFNIYNELSEQLEKVLPDDIYTLTNLKISLTEVSNFKCTNVLLDTWGNKSDFIKSIIISGFIPILGKHLYKPFKGRNYIDGGVTTSILDDDEFTLNIFYNKWRVIPNSWYIPCTDKKWNTYLYNLGKEDAHKHKSYLDRYFKSG